MPIHIHGDPTLGIDFTLKNVTLLPADGHENDAFLDAENFGRLILDGVKLEGFASPHMILRSDGKPEVSDSSTFSIERAAAGASGVAGV